MLCDHNIVTSGFSCNPPPTCHTCASRVKRKKKITLKPLKHIEQKKTSGTDTVSHSNQLYNGLFEYYCAKKGNMDIRKDRHTLG